MVLAQPQLTLSQVEPYRCTEESRAQQLAAISASLSIARESSHGADKTHFTLFPEYSIPAAGGIELVEDILRRRDWPAETIVIGGTDALSKAQFQALAAAPNTTIDTDSSAPVLIAADQWINCAITWIKSQDGSIRRWLQPKLSPAWREQNIVYRRMFRGNSVFLFTGQFQNGTSYRFCSLVCFDWIATVDGQRPWRAVVEALSTTAATLQAELSLSWLFVIQHNRRPSAESFMVEVPSFFDQTVYDNVRRDRTCLVFVNSAGAPRPRRAATHGNTSLIFAGNTLFTTPDCYSTFSNGGRKFRGHGLVEPHKDILFREAGACVHSFQQIDPATVVAGPHGKTIALANPSVHPIMELNDPRAPDGPVPASVKWLNDELDDIPNLSDTYAGASLAPAVHPVHSETVNDLRQLRGDQISYSMHLAVSPATGHAAIQHADAWNHSHRNAVTHLLHTLDILCLCSTGCSLTESPLHATLTIGELVLDVVAIRGQTHEQCLQHYQHVLPNGRHPVLLVSRDDDNNKWSPRLGRYDRPLTPSRSNDRDFTDPSKVSWQVGYRELLDIFQESDTVDSARERLHGKLER